MLLAIDIGNTNSVLGLFEGKTLRADWRLETRAGRTGDQYAALVATLFGLLCKAQAKAPGVGIVRPKNGVGRNTVASIQAGLVFGYAGLVDAIVGRIQAEVDFKPRVVGTGGLAPLIAAESKTIQECDDMLTL